MLIVLLHLIVLAGLMHLFAEHEADIHWPKMVVIFAPLLVILFLLSSTLEIMTIPVFFFSIMFCLDRWFYVGPGKAFVISGAFIVYLIVLALIVDNVMRPSRKDTGFGIRSQKAISLVA